MYNKKRRSITRAQAITNIVNSVAEEQSALARILHAESDKLERIISLRFVHPHEILEANKSVKQLINAVSKLELALQLKLDLFDACLCDDKHRPPVPFTAEDNID